jgi:hypothetical protein
MSSVNAELTLSVTFNNLIFVPNQIGSYFNDLATHVRKKVKRTGRYKPWFDRVELFENIGRLKIKLPRLKKKRTEPGNSY